MAATHPVRQPIGAQAPDAAIILESTHRMRRPRVGNVGLAATDGGATPLPPRVRCSSRVGTDDTKRRWRRLDHAGSGRDALLDAATRAEAAAYSGHIENFIGAVKVPVGLAGPLRVPGRAVQAISTPMGISGCWVAVWRASRIGAGRSIPSPRSARRARDQMCAGRRCWRRANGGCSWWSPRVAE